MPDTCEADVNIGVAIAAEHKDAFGYRVSVEYFEAIRATLRTKSLMWPVLYKGERSNGN